jgi:hypothetical protein
MVERTKTGKVKECEMYTYKFISRKETVHSLEEGPVETQKLTPDIYMYVT